MSRAMMISAAVVLAAVGVGCGGDDEESTGADQGSTEATITEATATGACTAVEEVDVEPFGTHRGRDFVAADYETNPPAGGDHNPTPLQGGSFYPRPPRLGESVHLLEHGAVIGWTNDLAGADQRAIEDAFNEVFEDGYYQLAVVENPELEVPFALSAWGAVQTCTEVDADVIRPFVEQHYAPAASGESALACQGEARKLPPCKALD